MKYNPQKHHRKSIRLSGYDYSQAGAYFITICTHNRECLFGEIENDKMILNDAGQMVFDEWMKTPELRPNVELDSFIVMPNHVHGIIVITETGIGGGRGVLHTPLNDTPQNENGEFNSPQPPENDTGEFNSPQPPENETPPLNTSAKKGEFNSPLRSPSQTVGAIVRGFKSSVTKKINEKGVFNTPLPPQQIWQRNYYEHIIRNEQSYQTISEYIINNPLKWKEDKFFIK